ncbi:MAG: ABC transporter permease [Vicingaceae bacterium]|jgi:ABC-type polysaccharide/polyol phosphate export permease
MKFIIEEISGLFRVYELLKYLVSSDFKILYRNKALGVLWAVLDPLFMTLVYVILVKVIFQKGGPDYPILLLSALMPWRWFTNTISNCTNVLISNGRLIQTVKISNIVFPVYQNVLGLINFLMGIIVLIPMLFIFNANITINILWFFPIVLCQFIFTVGLSFIVSYIGLYFRDLQNILTFVLKIGLYMSPVLYEITNIPEKYRQLYIYFNPFASLMDSYKNVLVKGQAINNNFLIFVLYSVLFFVLGLYIYHKKQYQFAKDV